IVDPNRQPWPQAKLRPVQPDDHSELVPLLPIPNRTVKRLSADDSAGSRVKVGHRQATNAQSPRHRTGAFVSLFQETRVGGSRFGSLAALSCCDAFKMKVTWLPGVMLPGVAQWGCPCGCVCGLNEHAGQFNKDGKTLDKMARNGIESRFSADDC